MLRPPMRQRGGVYLAVLFATAFLGLAATASAILLSMQIRREREAELLLIGAEFVRAIQSYHDSSPGAVKTYPQTLDDLLLDQRFLNPKRHLRQIYPDPISGERDWTAMPAPQGGVMGIASTSRKSPVKRSGFDSWPGDFTDKDHYSDWHFVYRPNL